VSQARPQSPHVSWQNGHRVSRAALRLTRITIATANSAPHTMARPPISATWTAPAGLDCYIPGSGDPMGFFTRDEGKKEDTTKKESERLATKAIEAKPVPKKATSSVLGSFVLGLRPNDKLENLPAERYEEGLRAVLPKGSKVTRLEGPLLVTDLSIRF